MDIDDVAVCLHQAHFPQHIGLRAEGFPVEEVAPAADALADEEAQGNHVQHHQGLDLAALAENDDADDRTDDAAVDGQAALPDIEGRDGVGGVLLRPAEDDVISAGAENREGGDPQDAVDQVILFQAEVLRAAAGVHDAQDQAEGDDRAVIMDGQRADGNGTARVHDQVQGGEGNFRISHASSSSMGSMTAMAMRSGRTTRLRNSRISSALTSA